MGEPALYICDSSGPYAFGSSSGHKYANLECLEDKLRLHFRYAISELWYHVKSSLIHILDLDIRTRLDHREYFEVHFQKAWRFCGRADRAQIVDTLHRPRVSLLGILVLFCTRRRTHYPTVDMAFDLAALCHGTDDQPPPHHVS
jgi:hypothetical protein